MTRQEALYKYTLGLGDNALVLSQRLSEWCSNAPIIEEDLALTNFALDMIGRAQVLLRYAGDMEGKGRDEDALAYRRSEREYFNNKIAELPNGDFAFTMVRQLFISAFELYFFEALQKSTDATLSAVAVKTLKEVKYHLAHASDWVIRLGDGTDESHNRTQDAVNRLWMYTAEQFEVDEATRQLLEEGISVDPEPLYKLWTRHITDVLDTGGLHVPVNGYMQTGSRQGIHTEHLGHLLAEMQYLPRAYPDAKW